MDDNNQNKTFVDFINSLIVKYRDIVMYLIFGVLTTIINIVVKYVLYSVCHQSTFISTTVAWIVAVIFAFVTNKFFVFNSEDASLEVIAKEGISFFICRIATYFLDVIIMMIGVDKLHLNFVLVAFASNVLVVIVNYIASKLFIFKKKD